MARCRVSRPRAVRVVTPRLAPRRRDLSRLLQKRSRRQPDCTGSRPVGLVTGRRGADPDHVLAGVRLEALEGFPSYAERLAGSRDLRTDALGPPGAAELEVVVLVTALVGLREQQGRESDLGAV